MYVTGNSPKGWHKSRFCYFFPVNFNFCRKNICCKVSSCENFQQQSCSYIIPLSNSTQKDCGGRSPHLPKIYTQSDPPLPKKPISTDFVRASEKSSIITNRKSTMRFPSSHRSTLCVTLKSPKGWLKMRILTFGVAFHFFVAGNRRHFKFGTRVEHSKSQPPDDKPSLKWAWLLYIQCVSEKTTLLWLSTTSTYISRF